MELIPLVEPKFTLRGFAERKWAEAKGLAHLTTLLLPVFRDRQVLIQIRPERKSFPGCCDIFGGHVTLDAALFSGLLGEPIDLERVVLLAAVREANEELRLIDTRGSTPHQHVVIEDELIRVGELGEFAWPASDNREFSTLYLVPIRDNCVPAPMDDIDGRFVPVETETLCPEEIAEKYSSSKQEAMYSRRVAADRGYKRNREEWQFADGAGRILTNPALWRRACDRSDVTE
jgi:hypothetical protein